MLSSREREKGCLVSFVLQYVFRLHQDRVSPRYGFLGKVVLWDLHCLRDCWDMRVSCIHMFAMSMSMSLSLSFISIHQGLEAEDFCNPVKGQLHWVAEQNGLIVIEAHSDKELVITTRVCKVTIHSDRPQMPLLAVESERTR